VEALSQKSPKKPLMGVGLMLECNFSVIRYLRPNRLLRLAEGTIFGINFIGAHAHQKAITKFAHLAYGLMLDVGCGNQPYRKLFEGKVARYYGMDWGVSHAQSGKSVPPDVDADALEMPFHDVTFHTVMCHQVIEHVEDPDKLISEISRILRPEGVLFLSGPGICPVHSPERDYYRLTIHAYRKLLNKHRLNIEHIVHAGYGGAVIARFLNTYLTCDLFSYSNVGNDPSVTTKLIRMVCVPFLLPFIACINGFCFVLDLLAANPDSCPNYFILARKRLVIDSQLDQHGESVELPGAKRVEDTWCDQ
jgi:SAM-dependent methyltransferase